MSDEYCELVHKCRSEKCQDDLYLLPGWDRTLPVVMSDLGDRFNGYLKKYFKDRDVYSCVNLPIFEMDHKITPVVEALVKEVDRHSGEKKVAFLGSSYGGILAQRMASNYPEKTSKIALLFSFQRVLKDGFLGVSPQEIKTISEKAVKFIKDISMLAIGTSHPEAPDEFLGSPEGFLNLLNVDETENNKKIKAKTFILNCLEDGFFGELPKIKGAIKKINFPCQHHRMNENDLMVVAKFLGEDYDI